MTLNSLVNLLLVLKQKQLCIIFQERLIAVQKKIKGLKLKKFRKIRDLLIKHPASKIFEATMKLIYLPNIPSNKGDVQIMDKVKNLVLLGGITESDFLKSYKSVQTKVKDVVEESTIDYIYIYIL